MFHGVLSHQLNGPIHSRLCPSDTGHGRRRFMSSLCVALTICFRDSTAESSAGTGGRCAARLCAAGRPLLLSAHCQVRIFMVSRLADLKLLDADMPAASNKTSVSPAGACVPVASSCRKAAPSSKQSHHTWRHSLSFVDIRTAAQAGISPDQVSGTVQGDTVLGGPAEAVRHEEFSRGQAAGSG